MRRSFACTGFHKTAIVLAASFFSLPASAAKLTAVPATYDPATRVATLGFKLEDPCSNGYTSLRLYEVVSGDTKVIATFPTRTVGDILYFDLANYPLGLHTIHVVFSGFCGIDATFTYVVPSAGWLPAVIDYVLSD